MFEQLNERFAKIVKNLKGQGKITDRNISETVRDIRRALLEADVNFLAAKSFVERISESAKGENVFDSVTPGQQFIKILLDELTLFLGHGNNDLLLNKSSRTVIMLVGLQGVGKTTTAVKLASFLKNKWHKSPYLIAADLKRAAAIDQLEVLGREINIPVFSDRQMDIKSVINTGLSKSEDSDVVIIDTAGRLHIDNDLMVELKEIIELSNPSEILYIADGMTGQDAVNSSKSFNELIDITGVILTKMDGDSRGGAALSIREVTGKPIKFIGIGEKSNDFEIFHPERMAKRILGMGDVVSLVEKAQEVFDNENAKEMQDKIVNNSFTLVDFQNQLLQMNKLGSMQDIVNMLPLGKKLNNIKYDDRKIKWIDAIIKSMTPEERINHEIINGSRRKRIAKGSGRTIQEVNQLLKQFHQMRKMMKNIGNNKKIKIPFWN